MPIHPEREHGTAGDLQRHALHHLAQIDRRVTRRLQLRHGLVDGAGHMRDQRAYRARREGRRQRAALVLPGAALRDQDAVAQDGAQHADAGRGAGIVLVIVDQDVLDGVGRVEDEAAASHEATLDDVFLVGAVAPGLDRVDAHRPHAAERRHAVGRAGRGRRHQRPAGERQVDDFGNAHGASLGLRFTPYVGPFARRFKGG